MLDKYILNEKHEPVPVPDDFAWWEWFSTFNRKVAQAEVGSLIVSTIFVGIDLGFGDGPPQVFETMIFGGESGHEPCWRCSTWADALLMHELAVIEAEAKVKAGK